MDGDRVRAHSLTSMNDNFRMNDDEVSRLPDHSLSIVPDADPEAPLVRSVSEGRRREHIAKTHHSLRVPQSIPAYLRIPSPNEQVSIAYFPMGASGFQPGSRIASVTRNTVDGRIRCELRDSTIHAREETTEGIPVDYHLVWESAVVASNTFRSDYYIVKQNGKVFLTPINVVHMRAVLEPKGTRNENQRVGIVSQSIQQESRHDPAVVGKWISYEPEISANVDFFKVDERNLRETSFKEDEAAADFGAVVKLALGLDSATGVTDLPQQLPGQRRGMNIDKIESIFKHARIQKFSSVQKVMDRPVEEVLRALTNHAYLVQGNWVGHATIYFTAKTSDKTKLPFHTCFEYFLYFFSKERTVDVSLPNQNLKLSVTTLNGLLSMMGKFVSGTKWKFLSEPDTDFIRGHPDVVRQQGVAWEERRHKIESTFKELERVNASLNIPIPPVASKVSTTGTEPPQTPILAKKVDVPVPGKRKASENSLPTPNTIATAALKTQQGKRGTLRGRGRNK